MFHRKPEEKAGKHQWRAGEEIYLGQPAQYPQVLVEGLKRYFLGHPEVDAAYLAQVFTPKSGDPPHPVIGIRLCPGVGKPILQTLPDLGAIVAQSAGPGLPIDFVEISRNEISKYMVEHTTPFYRAAA